MENKTERLHFFIFFLKINKDLSGKYFALKLHKNHILY